MNSRSLSLLSILFFVSLLCEVLPISSQTTKIRDKGSGQRSKYKIILRVVRPRWRVQPTQSEAHSVQYCALMSAPFVTEDPESDAQFLAKLRASNPNFSFDHILAKTSKVLKADQTWQVSPHFSMQQLQLAVVRKDRKLLLTHSEMRNSGDISIRFATKPDRSPHQTMNHVETELPPQYKGGYTQALIDKMYKHGDILLSYYIKQFYQTPKGRKPFITGDLTCNTTNKSTFYLVFNLPVFDIGPNHQPVLFPIDVICATVIEQK